MTAEPPIWDNPCRNCQHWYTCIEKSRAMICTSYVGQTGKRNETRKTQCYPYKTHHDVLMLQNRKEEYPMMIDSKILRDRLNKKRAENVESTEHPYSFNKGLTQALVILGELEKETEEKEG